MITVKTDKISLHRATLSVGSGHSPLTPESIEAFNKAYINSPILREMFPTREVYEESILLSDLSGTDVSRLLLYNQELLGSTYCGMISYQVARDFNLANMLKTFQYVVLKEFNSSIISNPTVETISLVFRVAPESFFKLFAKHFRPYVRSLQYSGYKHLLNHITGDIYIDGFSSNFSLTNSNGIWLTINHVQKVKYSYEDLFTTPFFHTQELLEKILFNILKEYLVYEVAQEVIERELSCKLSL